MSPKRSLFADIMGVFNTNIVVLAIGFIIGIILPRQLGPEATGIYFAILVVPQLMHGLIDLGTKPTVVFLTGKKIYPDEKIFSALIFVFAISTTACVVFFSVIYYFLDNPDYTVPLITLVMLITPLRLLASYAQAFVLAKEKIRKYNRMNWLFPACNLLGVIVFVVILKLGVKGALTSLLFSALVVALYAIITVISKQRIRLKVDFGIVRNIYKHGIIYALSFFVIKMNYRIDIFLMERLSTFRETGFYALGVNVAELIFQIPLALWVVVVTRAANATDQKAMTRTVLKLLRVAFLFAFLGSIAMFFLAPYAITWIYGAKFTASISIVQSILPGIMFIVIFKVLNGHLSGIGKPYIAALCFIPSILINIGLNLWWIPIYGAMGAVMATNISYTLGAFILLIVYAKRMKASFREIFLFKKDDFNFIRTIYNKLIGKRETTPDSSTPDQQ